jgi:hypothetical protein
MCICASFSLPDINAESIYTFIENKEKQTWKKKIRRKAARGTVRFVVDG